MGNRKIFSGTVVSDKMQKTRTVKISRLAKHRKYGKTIKQSAKFKAHDEKNATKIGDVVRIEETRPLSKDKRWRIIEIIKKAEVLHVEIQEEVK